MGNYSRNRNNNAKIRAEITETERNTTLYKKYASGQYTKSGLARMYRITRQRVDQIIKREEEAQLNG